MKKTADQIKLTQNLKDQSVLESERKALLAEIEGLEPELDYSKPVIATNSDNSICLLMANCDTKSYNVKGYDWLRLSDGNFNSSRCWPTPQEAVAAYSGNNPRNVDFDDLAAQGKPLDEFKVDAGNCKKGANQFEANIFENSGEQFLNISCCNYWFTLDRAIEIHRKLGRLIAKLKLDKAKK